MLSLEQLYDKGALSTRAYKAVTKEIRRRGDANKFTSIYYDYKGGAHRYYSVTIDDLFDYYGADEIKLFKNIGKITFLELCKLRENKKPVKVTVRKLGVLGG